MKSTEKDGDNTLIIRRYVSLENLSLRARSFLERSGEKDFFCGFPWFHNLESTVVANNEEAVVYVAENDEDDLASGALLIRRPKRVNWLSGGKVLSLTSPYTIFFDIAYNGNEGQRHRMIAALVDALVKDNPKCSTITIDCILHDNPSYSMISKYLRSHGYCVEEHFHFVNWYQIFTGISFNDYRRDLQSSLRRLSNRADRREGLTFRIIVDGDELQHMIEQYERLSFLRWNEPEPYENFISGLVNAAHSANALQFGVIESRDEVVAAQIWLVAGGRATIFKIAHNPAYSDKSFGSMLTICMIRHVLNAGDVNEIDFGRGDDSYKKDWLRTRRECWGITAYNPRTPIGFLLCLASLVKRIVRPRAGS